jgi:uncharacterized membrane protein (UPF0127 family)
MLARSVAVIGLILLTTVTGGCAPGAEQDAAGQAEAAAGLVAVTVTSANGPHRFQVESAATEEEQQRGLMFRTDIPENGGMLFAPYPPSGAPREASFWMKDTPTPLDILFIRPDRTIARIAENTIPQSEIPVASGEPVAAVLELRGGRSLDLGIKEGDRVSWTAPKAR